MNNESYVQDMLDSMFEMLEVMEYHMQAMGTVEIRQVLGAPETRAEKWSGHFTFINEHQPNGIVITMQIPGLEQPEVSSRMHIISMATAFEDLARKIRNEVLT